MAFTLFNTVEQNDAFLSIINYADNGRGSFPKGDGLCENMCQYSKLNRVEQDGDDEPTLMDMDLKEYKDHLKMSKGGHINGCTLKDNYPVFCIYVRAGTTQIFAACLCGISAGCMSDIFHEWAQILNDALQE